ncbi:mitochondrial carrier protein [Nitzschia inconspicua]|uniref:Mitochondrial carrier protein n=1 Tax=Nitzschia inconspicua TaxID=303405 RepID=A0A9K3L3G2_9STRA|nr:mitochondrial carrier protein [Nitzschia inconspicua]
MVTSNNDRVALSSGENLAVGAFGGALETCLQMPVLTYKFCLQEGRPLPTNIPGWYRGVVVQAGTVAPITAIQFMFNGILQKALLRGNTQRSLSDGEVIAAAAGAGAISAIVYSPVDLLTIQQQKLHLNLWNTTRTLVENYGVSGMYRGFSACVAREALYTAGYLGLAPVITSRLVGQSDYLRERPLAASILGACAAGTLAAVTTHPIDTAKTCLQSDMDGTNWKNTFGTMKTLMSTGGIASLYRGMLPRTVRLCGAFFVCLMVRDAAIEYKTQKAHERGLLSEAASIAAGLETTVPLVATSSSEDS